MWISKIKCPIRTNRFSVKRWWPTIEVIACAVYHSGCHHFYGSWLCRKMWRVSFPDCCRFVIADEKAAERGIVYIDELTRLPANRTNPSLPGCFWVRQQGMLKSLEGSEVLVPPSGWSWKTSGAKLSRSIPTTSCLFVGGAFDGIEKIIARRVNTQVIGQNRRSEEIDKEKPAAREPTGHQNIWPYTWIGRPCAGGCSPGSFDVIHCAESLTEPRNALVKQYEKSLLSKLSWNFTKCHWSDRTESLMV